jgi:hypothetical protein
MRSASAESRRRPHLADAAADGWRRDGECQHEEPGDLRFCALTPPQAWAILSEPVRRGSCRRRAGVLVGELTQNRVTMAGLLLAQPARLFGTPFSTSRNTGVPSVVGITAGFATGGRTWTTLHAGRAAFPQVIRSRRPLCRRPVRIEVLAACCTDTRQPVRRPHRTRRSFGSPLDVTHRRLGRLICRRAVFREIVP